jgi:hypothetical protein
VTGERGTAARLAPLLPLLGVIVLMLGLPPLGAVLGGLRLETFLAFPLDQRAFDPLPPDPRVLAGAALGLVLALAWVGWAAWPRRPLAEAARQARSPTPAGRWPRWGAWGGLSLGAAITAALGGASGLSQPLLVLGLTLVVAAHVERRTGTSVVSQRPLWFALLFPVSALVGWSFHWLNQFLQLWTYPGSGDESAIPFVLARTLDYATLLPALLALRQWLAAWPPLLDASTRARRIAGSGYTQEGWLYLAAGSIGLTGAAIWPDAVWPLSWIAPLMLALGMQQASGSPTLFSGTREGDWSRILIPALAALLLGLLIQAWNRLTGPAWVFDLPLVQAWPLFGLPLLAYAGLLPLGPLGIWIADQLAHPWRSRPQGRQRPFPVRISIGR